MDSTFGAVHGTRRYRSGLCPTVSPATVSPAVTVPTLDELTGLSRLLTATDWEKAAIVAAFVESDAGHGKRPILDVSESAKAFAARKIAGLSSATTVLRYVAAWTEAGQQTPRAAAGGLRRVPGRAP